MNGIICFWAVMRLHSVVLVWGLYTVLSNGYNLICMLMDCTASMARKIYLRGGLGVGSFQRIYGGSKRNGSRPPHFGKSSGSVARHILQQLQNMNIVELEPRG